MSIIKSLDLDLTTEILAESLTVTEDNFTFSMSVVKGETQETLLEVTDLKFTAPTPDAFCILNISGKLKLGAINNVYPGISNHVVGTLIQRTNKEVPVSFLLGFNGLTMEDTKKSFIIRTVHGIEGVGYSRLLLVLDKAKGEFDLLLPNVRVNSKLPLTDEVLFLISDITDALELPHDHPLLKVVYHGPY